MARTLGRRFWGAVLAVAVVGAMVTVGLAAPGWAAPTTAGAQVAPRIAGPCATGSLPAIPAWNPVKHWMYIPNENSGNITVLSGSCHLVGTITLPLGASPIAIAYDPANNWMYVTDDSLDQVYAYSGLTLQATITSTLITAPFDIIWDPGDSLILLTNDFGSFTVVGISGSSVVGSVTVGNTPQGLCYDPFYNAVLVLNRFGNNVTILNGYNPLVLAPLANTGTGFAPRYCVFDPADNTDYITNQGDNNVTLINGAGTQLGSVNVGSLPAPIGWDQATLQVFVGNTLHGGISVISGTSVVKNIAAHASGPQGFAYDESTDSMYLTAGSSNLVYIET